MKKFLDLKLAKFKHPKYHWISNSPLPRGGTDKINKSLIRELCVNKDYFSKLRRILKINYIEANKSEIKIFESIDNESKTNKSTVFFEFSNKYTEVLFSKPDVNIIRYSTRAALTTVINPYADDDKFNKSTYTINSDFVEKIRELVAD